MASREAEPQPSNEKWRRKAAGLLCWAAFAVWLGSILYPWINRLIVNR